jgi:hypothetical protein
MTMSRSDDQVMCNCWHCRMEILYGQPHFARPDIWPERHWCSEACFIDWEGKQYERNERMSAAIREIEEAAAEVTQFECFKEYR